MSKKKNLERSQRGDKTPTYGGANRRITSDLSSETTRARKE